MVAAELKPATRQAFDRYTGRLADLRMHTLHGEAAFLRDSFSPQQRQRMMGGEVVISKVELSTQSGDTPVPDGMIHHWRATVFVPGADLQQALTLLQDYDHHKDLYKSEVTASRLLKREGNHFTAYMRFYKKKIIGVTLNTIHEADYVTLNPKQAYSNSHTTKIAEVENAGQKDEKEKPVGKDGGFLWALNSYWRLEEADGGVYIQCEAVSLTRDIPALVAWVVKPFVTEVPKESLFNTMQSTRTGLLQRVRH